MGPVDDDWTTAAVLGGLLTIAVIFVGDGPLSVADQQNEAMFYYSSLDN
jgi:hypothetical protein